MPFKDKQKRYEAIRKSWAKKPEKYAALVLKKERSRSRRGYHVARRYGITVEAYEALVAKHQGLCAICGNEQKPTASGRDGLRVDHCHTTGKVRGLLCVNCNWLVGHYEKSNGPEVFRKVGEYVYAHSTS